VPLVLVLVLLVAIAAVVVGVGSLLFGAGRRFDDVERFHRARGITTEWARAGVTSPYVGAQPDRSHERREQRQQEPADA
jgi:hypothetical protein